MNHNSTTTTEPMKGLPASGGPHQQQPRRLAVRVAEAARLLDISRSKAYELIRTGALPSIQVGKTVRVPVDALEALVRCQTALQEHGEEKEAT